MPSFVRTVSFAFLVLLPAVAGAQIPAVPLDEGGQLARPAASTRPEKAPHVVMDAQDTSALTAMRVDGRLSGLVQNQAPGSQRRRDSLWNGAVIGAGLGAIAGAVAGTAIVECSECAGFNVPLTFGVVGAGIGAAIGAGIDALHHDHSIVTGSPTRTRRVNLFPLVGKRAQALAASVRF